MSWPWAFLDLTPEDKQNRRLILDYYATVAQYSAFLPVVAYFLLQAVSYLLARFKISRSRNDSRTHNTSTRGRYQQVGEAPSSHSKSGSPSSPSDLGQRWSRIAWWMDDDVYLRGAHYGRRSDWILGLAWTAWLVALCVVGTGRDYYHLCKRFGIIPMSQLPAHYLLANKILNPFAWVFGTSHEALNRYHRVLGRIIYGLLIVHFILYNASFVVRGVWWSKTFSPIVLWGVLASFLMHAIFTTAMRQIREYAYRVFFVTHVLAGFAIPFLIFFHAHAARWYVLEAVVVFLADLTVRKLTTTIAPATVEIIPGSSLLKISLEVTPSRAAEFNTQPGSHLYLEIPKEGRPDKGPVNKNLADFIQNPFTVSSVDQQRGVINIVARTRAGPISSHLAHLASLQPSQSGLRIPLGFEGPYGEMAKHHRDILDSGVNRILLIAGGVGATFTLPLYRSLLRQDPDAKIQMIWAIRSASDATWAVPPGRTTSEKHLLDDPNIQLFLTSDIAAEPDTSTFVIDDDDEDTGTGEHHVGNTELASVEMSAMLRSGSGSGSMAHRSSRRPDLQEIINDTFSQNPAEDESVAVIVCGPAEMAREARRHVGEWVQRGRRVWWHSESFGW